MPNTDLPLIDLEQMPRLGDIAKYHGTFRPNVTALSFEGRETTYAELDLHVRQVGNALLAQGVKKGQRIGYLGKNCDRYFEILLGAAAIGAVLTPIGWRLAPTEIAYILKDCSASLLFLGPEVISQGEQAILEAEANPKVIAMEAGSNFLTFEQWRDNASSAPISIAIDNSDIALQIYTSGTTGRPKGAMLSHASLLTGRRRAAKAQLPWNMWTPDDVSLIAMPAAHVGGTLWGVLGLLNGAKGVVAREFDPFKVLDFIEQDRISKIFMVPSALSIVVRQPRAHEVDYSRLKYILYGASPIPLDLLRECMEVFGCGFCQQYGMTETSGSVVYLPPEDHDPRGNSRMRAAGIPLPGVEIKITGAVGETLPPKQVGEIAIRSVSNMVGYWGMEAATAATIDTDGWLHTGDAGYLDEDGYLYIHDRVKDMIISGGENIYPAEVENAIFGHPQVAEVAVIGVPDEKWGEAIKAIVVPKFGTSPDPNDIIAFARSRIAKFKAPKSVDFIDALPRNPSGKVLRRELRERYWAGHARRVN